MKVNEESKKVYINLNGADKDMSETQLNIHIENYVSEGYDVVVKSKGLGGLGTVFHRADKVKASTPKVRTYPDDVDDVIVEGKPWKVSGE